MGDPGVGYPRPARAPHLFPLPPLLPAVTAGRNPCTDRNAGCLHTCRLLRGRAHCECHAGYRLAADHKACEGKMPFLRLGPAGQLCRGRLPASCEQGWPVSSAWADAGWSPGLGARGPEQCWGLGWEEGQGLGGAAFSESHVTRSGRSRVSGFFLNIPHIISVVPAH